MSDDKIKRVLSTVSSVCLFLGFILILIWAFLLALVSRQGFDLHYVYLPIALVALLIFMWWQRAKIRFLNQDILFHVSIAIMAFLSPLVYWIVGSFIIATTSCIE